MKIIEGLCYLAIVTALTVLVTITLALAAPICPGCRILCFGAVVGGNVQCGTPEGCTPVGPGAWSSGAPCPPDKPPCIYQFPTRKVTGVHGGITLTDYRVTYGPLCSVYEGSQYRGELPR